MGGWGGWFPNQVQTPHISPRNSPFLTQIAQKPWGGWVHIFGRDLPKRNGFIFGGCPKLHHWIAPTTFLNIIVALHAALNSPTIEFYFLHCTRPLRGTPCTLHFMHCIQNSLGKTTRFIQLNLMEIMGSKATGGEMTLMILTVVLSKLTTAVEISIWLFLNLVLIESLWTVLWETFWLSLT